MGLLSGSRQKQKASEKSEAFLLDGGKSLSVGTPIIPPTLLVASFDLPAQNSGRTDAPDRECIGESSQ
jgi:hypothetical protein